MKFKQLNIGQEFEYQGKTYIKTTPLIAKHVESGKQKLIPHYIELSIHEDSTPSKKEHTQELTIELVSLAISQHETELKEITKVIKNNIDDNISVLLISRIENACHELYKKLDLNKD